MMAEIECELPKLSSWTQLSAAALAALPGCPAVLLLVDADGAPVQLATSQHLRRFVQARLLPEEAGSPVKADLTQIVRGVRWCEVSCPFEARWRHWRVARRLFPDDYRKRIGFGPAWFLQRGSGTAVEEIRIVDRAADETDELVGPWPTQRAATRALEGLWDLFELCRYPEQVQRAPLGRRCAYADMGRCDAPCDGAAPLGRYADRVAAAWRFACGGLEEWATAAAARMRAAVAEQAFERAGLLKQQMEFAEKWRTEWSSRLRLWNEWRETWLIPLTRRKAWKVFLFERGWLSDGPVVTDRKLAAEAANSVLQLAANSHSEISATERMERAWLAAHFLQHREAESSIILRLNANENAAELTQRIVAAKARIRPPTPSTEKTDPQAEKQ